VGDIEKRLNKTALKVAGVWGTVIAGLDGAGNGLLPLNPGVPKRNLQMIEDESNSAFDVNLDVGNTNVSDFTLDFDYRWDGIENVLLGLLMGVDTAPAQQGGTAAYLHTVTLSNSNVGKFASYAVEKGGDVHTVPSLKVLKATFSTANGLIRASFGLRGSEITSATTTLGSTTTPSNAHIRAKFNQAVFRMNDYTVAGGGTTLGTGHIVKPKAFTLEIERKFDTEHTSGSAYIIEPIENDKPGFKLTMEFPRMDATNAAYFANWLAGTDKKADIYITGPLAATAYPYVLRFEFPHLIIEDVEYADAKIVPAKVVLRGATADVAQTGLTGLLPLGVFLTNLRTASLIV
jgi:hypothetical protein